MRGSRGALLGVGPKPLPFRSLTAERLAEHIRAATGSPAYRQCAAALAEKLRGEMGVRRAAEIIERL